MKPIRPGDPLLASTFNEIKQSLGGDFVHYGTGLGGGINRSGYPAFSSGLGESGWIYALLSGGFSPYSWQEKHLDDTGAWVDGPLSGTGNAWEVNGQVGLGGVITRIRPGESTNDWRFQHNRQPGCTPVCVTVVDNCGPHNSQAVYIAACDEWYDSTFALTDANGIHLRTGNQEWASSPWATDLIPFSSSHIFSTPTDCTHFRSGTGVYGYYWSFHDDGTVTMTLRVYASICPPLTPLDTAVFADAPGDATGPPSSYIVEFDSTALADCTYNADFTFDFPATRYTGGPGDPPHGNVTLPVGGANLSASVMASDRVSGATVSATSQGGESATCTTNKSGTCCLSLASGLWWVQVSKSGCQQPGCQLVVQEVNQCPPVCEETVTCSACSGIELMTKHGTVKIGGVSTNLIYNTLGGYWQSGQFGFLTDIAYYSDSVFGGCYAAPSSIVPYYFRFYCSGDNLTCDLWTYPISSCDSASCGYYMGDGGLGIPPDFVKQWTVSGPPTCTATNVLQSFTFDPIEGVCSDPVPPPVDSIDVSFNVGALNHNLCCLPCPFPRRNLSYRWANGFGGGGSGTLTYALPGWWTAPDISVTCGNVIFFGLQLDSTPTYYTCDPFYLKWIVSGVTYEIIG